MTLPPLSVDQDASCVKIKPVHDVPYCKRTQWYKFSSHLRNRAARMETFVQRCTDSIHELTESHIRISEGFTVGRQLKHFLLQTVTFFSRVS